VKGLRGAAAFLTRLPVGGGADEEPADIARSLPWFPVVGAILGAGVAGVYAGALQLLPTFAAAGVAVVASVALTGAFHEDGLADTADALGAWEPAEARRILKDPTHGTYGVSALVLVLVLRVAAISALGGWSALAVLPAAQALGRSSALGVLGYAPAATEEGLGASYAAHVTRRRVLGVAGVGLALALGALGVWALPAALMAAAGALVVARVAVARFAGLTGDVLGAAEQVSETVVLLLGAAVVSNGWGGLPWWR
jgi:adenosylcobinamide-GDP ribazoletransferase